MPQTETITLRLVAADLASGQISKAVAGIDKMAQRGGIAGSVMQGVGLSMGMMLNPLTLATRGFGAVTGALGNTIGAAGDFEEAMTKSTAIMGDLSDSMKNKMGRVAREVAKDTRFSAEQVAEAYFYLASAGLDAEQSIGAIDRVADFATAGAFDLAQATDLLTDAQSALGLTVDDTAQNMENMTRTSDVLVKANTLANATVEQFSTALTSKAGAALKAFGIDMEEGVAVLAAFADQGVKAEEAGNALDRILRLLPDAALKNAAAFDKFGIEVFDSSGEINNLGAIIGQLEVALDGMSDAEKQATLSALGFQARVQGIIKPLLGTSAAIREYEDELRRAGGTTEDVADKQLDTFNAEMDKLRSKLYDVALDVGPHFIGFINSVMDLLPTTSARVERLAIEVDALADEMKLARGEAEEMSDVVEGIDFSALDARLRIGHFKEWSEEAARYAEQLGWTTQELESFLLLSIKDADQRKAAIEVLQKQVVELDMTTMRMRRASRETEGAADGMGDLVAAAGPVAPAIDRIGASFARVGARISSVNIFEGFGDALSPTQMMKDLRRELGEANKELKGILKNDGVIEDEKGRDVMAGIQAKFQRLLNKLPKTMDLGTPAGDLATLYIAKLGNKVLGMEADLAADMNQLGLNVQDDFLTGGTTDAAAFREMFPAGMALKLIGTAIGGLTGQQSDQAFKKTADVTAVEMRSTLPTAAELRNIGSGVGNVLGSAVYSAVDRQLDRLQIRIAALKASIPVEPPLPGPRGPRPAGSGSTDSVPDSHTGGFIGPHDTHKIRQNEAFLSAGSGGGQIVPLDGPFAPKAKGGAIHLHFDGATFLGTDAEARQWADKVGPHIQSWMERA